MAKELLYVFVGGGIGSVLRFAITKYSYGWVRTFPVGTFISNILASFLLGFLFYLFTEKIIQHNGLRLMLMVGVCGGFSTFSTFTMENYDFIKNEAFGPFIYYSVLSIVISLVGFYAGVFLAKLF